MPQNPNLSEIARALAASRRRVKGACAVCGQPIEGITKRRYCSDSCRVRAAYRRNRGIPVSDSDARSVTRSEQEDRAPDVERLSC